MTKSNMRCSLPLVFGRDDARSRERQIAVFQYGSDRDPGLTLVSDREVPPGA